MAVNNLLAAETTALAKLLLLCLCRKLDEYERPVCRCSRMSGEQPIADFCEIQDGKNGQAWVRLVRVFATNDFPNPMLEYRCGEMLYAAEFELGILRCAVGPDDDGTPPIAKELNLEADAMDIDMAILLNVAGCCLPSTFPRLSDVWQPLSGGGCVGGRINTQVLMVPGPHPDLGA